MHLDLWLLKFYIFTGSNRHGNVEYLRNIISCPGQDGLNVRLLDDTTCSVVGRFLTRGSKCLSCLYDFCTVHTAMGHQGHIVLNLRASHNPCAKAATKPKPSTQGKIKLAAAGQPPLQQLHQVASSSAVTVPSSRISLEEVLADALKISVETFQQALINYKELLKDNAPVNPEQAALDMVAVVYERNVEVLGGDTGATIMMKTSEAVYATDRELISLQHQASGYLLNDKVVVEGPKTRCGQKRCNRIGAKECILCNGRLFCVSHCIHQEHTDKLKGVKPPAPIEELAGGAHETAAVDDAVNDDKCIDDYAKNQQRRRLGRW